MMDVFAKIVGSDLLDNNKRPYYESILDIIDNAPLHKLENIVSSNDQQLIKILAKLIALTVDIQLPSTNPNLNNNNNNNNINGNTGNLSLSTTSTTKNDIVCQSLISLRKICPLGMSSRNLFIKYKASDDIKFQILCYLKEMEIHKIMSNVDHEWNNLCKHTFNHAAFSYTFKSYVNKLFDNDVSSIGSSGSGNSLKDKDKDRDNCRDVYVQCPWNYLWTKGKIVSVLHKKSKYAVLNVEVNCMEYNPFNNNNNDKNTVSIENNNDSNKNKNNNNNNNNFTRRSHNTLRYFRDARPNQRYFDTTNDLIKASDYCHHIAPRFTIENSKINSSKNFDHFAQYRDHFGRILVDCKLKPFYLWKSDHSRRQYVKIASKSNNSNSNDKNNGKNNGNGSGDSDDNSSKDWVCGVLDEMALELFFPQFRETEIYQIPVLIDITEILDHYVDDVTEIESFSQFHNIFQLNNNRWFVRLWYNPNKRDILKFGKKSIKHWQNRMLSIPTNMHHVQGYDFMHQSRLTLNELFNEYLIDESKFDSSDFDSVLNEHFKDDKFTFCFRDYDGELIKTKLIKRTSEFFNDVDADADGNVNDGKLGMQLQSGNKNINGKKSKYMLIPESIDDRIIELKDRLEDYDDIVRLSKLNHFYRVSTLYHRPRVIKFPLANSLLYNHVNVNNCFYIDVRPLSISFECTERSLWQHKWSVNRINNELYNNNKNIDASKLTFQHFFPMYYAILNEQLFWQREWKIGIICNENGKAIQDRNRLTDFLFNKDYLNGQIQVAIDITNEFDQFQEKLKRDWMMYYGISKTKKKHNIFCDEFQIDDDQSDDDWLQTVRQDNDKLKEKKKEKEKEKDDNENGNDKDENCSRNGNKNESEWVSDKYFRHFVGGYKDRRRRLRKWVYYWVHLDDDKEVAPFRTHTKGKKLPGIKRIFQVDHK